MQLSYNGPDFLIVFAPSFEDIAYGYGQSASMRIPPLGEGMDVIDNRPAVHLSVAVINFTDQLLFGSREAVCWSIL